MESTASVSESLAAQQSRADLSSIRGAAEKYRTGDTLIVVQFPHDAGKACDGHPWETIKFRMSSTVLIGTGSRRLKTMLEPRAQKRFMRRLQEIIQLPADVAYVIDFTPETEDEDDVDLFTHLCLPEKVRSWFLAGYYIGSPLLNSGPKGPGRKNRPHANCAVGAPLVLGHDDRCLKGPYCLLHRDEGYAWEPAHSLKGVVHYEGDDVPLQYRIPESCPIRHRVGIVRLLLAINGAHLAINSAQRMWTTVWLAHHFEVTDHVRDAVLTWFMAFPNTKFIEVCPEESFSVARALQLPDVAQASFKVLVNELAIDYAATGTTSGKPRYTFSQRKRDKDFESDAIDYAARDLAERMKTTYQSLLGEDPFSLFPFGQWRKLQLLGKSIATAAASHNPSTAIADLLTAFLRLKTALVDTFNSVLKEQCAVPRLYLESLIEAQRDQYVPEFAQRQGDEDRVPIRERYTSLCMDQKILTTPFWFNMQRLFEDQSGINEPEETSQYINTFNACMRFAMNEYPVTFDCSQFAGQSQDLSNFFNPDNFWAQLQDAFNRFAISIMGHLDHHTEHGFILSEHLLLTLSEREMNYLPVWAGGLDDGTFGAFIAENIPETDMGPNQPGPSYHTGRTIGYGGGDDATSAAGTVDTRASDLAMSQLGLDDVTVAGSVDAQNSISTNLPRGRVALAPSEASETFASECELYADAKYFQPAAQSAGSFGEMDVQERETDEYDTLDGLDGDEDNDDVDDIDILDETSSTSTLSAFEQL